MMTRSVASLRVDITATRARWVLMGCVALMAAAGCSHQMGGPPAPVAANVVKPPSQALVQELTKIANDPSLPPAQKMSMIKKLESANGMTTVQ
jgi:hypothetical protein